MPLLLHPRVDPKTCLTETSFCDIKVNYNPLGLTEDQRQVLFRYATHFSGSAQRFMEVFLNERASQESFCITSDEKHLLIKLYSIIVRVLADEVEDVQLSEDAKRVTVSRLCDSFDTTYIFHYISRAMSIVADFKVPKTFDELLTQYRVALVDNAVSVEAISGTHWNVDRPYHYLEAVASSLGIPGAKIKVAYEDNEHMGIFSNNLKAMFAKQYTPAGIVSALLNSAVVQIDRYQYIKYDGIGYLDDYVQVNKDKQTSVDWLQLHTNIVQHLEKKYFAPPKKAKQQSWVFADKQGYHKLYIDYEENDIANAKLTYKCFGEHENQLCCYATYLAVIDPQGVSPFLNFLPDTLFDALASMLIDSGQIDQSISVLVSLVAASGDRPAAKTQPLLNKELHDRVNTAGEFERVLRDLMPEQRAAFCLSVKDELPNLITKVNVFNLVLRSLAPKQCATVYMAHKDKFFKLVTTAKELFGTVLEGLTPEQCVAIINADKIRFSELVVKQESNLFGGGLLGELSSEQVPVIHNAFKDELLERVEHKETLAHVLKFLSYEHRMLFESKFFELAKTADDFSHYVLKFIGPEQFTVLCDKYKRELLELIKTPESLGCLLEGLMPEQCAVICKLVKDECPKLVSTAKQFGAVLSDLMPRQYVTVCEEFKDQLPKLITSIQAFFELLKALESNICRSEVAADKIKYIFNAVKAELAKWIEAITDKDELSSVGKMLILLAAPERVFVLQRLKPEFRTNIILSKKDYLHRMFVDVSAFDDVRRLPTQSFLDEVAKGALAFSSILTDLSEDQFARVCKFVIDKFPMLFEMAGALGRILTNLTCPQCTTLCTLVKGKFPELVTTAAAFYVALKNLVPEQRAAVCSIFNNELREAINSMPERSTIVSDAVNIELMKLVATAIESDKSLKNLMPEQATAASSGEKTDPSTRFKTASEIGNLLQELTPADSVIVCNAYQHELRKLITSAKELGELLADLTLQQPSHVCYIVKDKFSSLITNTDQLFAVIGNLQPQQYLIVFCVICDQCPKLISSLDRTVLYDLLNDLTVEQSTVICKLIKATLLKWITSAGELGAVLKDLTLEQSGVVCNIIKDELPTLITTASELGEALKGLTPEQSALVCNMLKATLPKLIPSVTELSIVLKNLEPEQCEIVFDAIIAVCPNLITSALELGDLLESLTPQQTAIICDIIKAKFPKLISNTFELDLLLENLEPKQREIVFTAVIAVYPNLIRSPQDLGRVLKNFKPEQYKVVFGVITAVYPNLITSARELGQALTNLELKQFVVVFNLINAAYPKLITRYDELDSLLRSLTPQQSFEVCKIIEDRLPDLITTTTQLSLLLYHLDKQDRPYVVNIIKDKLPKMIRNPSELNQVLSPMVPTDPEDPKEREDIVKLVIDKLPEMAQTRQDFSEVTKYLPSNQFKPFMVGLYQYDNDSGTSFVERLDALEYSINQKFSQRCSYIHSLLKDDLPKLEENYQNIRKSKRRWLPGLFKHNRVRAVKILPGGRLNNHIEHALENPSCRTFKAIEKTLHDLYPSGLSSSSSSSGA